MIKVGTDILEIERMQKAMQKQRFLDRVFTKNEQIYIKKASIPEQTATGIFCAKEATAKAIGCGFGAELSFLDVEIYHDENGAPLIMIKSTPQNDISISISHCKLYATATAIKA